jgi:hypothetical protein
MPRAERKYDLADVYDLCRPVADDVYAQQFERVGMKKKLQETLLVPQHLSLGQFGVARQAHFIGNLVPG